MPVVRDAGLFPGRSGHGERDCDPAHDRDHERAREFARRVLVKSHFFRIRSSAPGAGGRTLSATCLASLACQARFGNTDVNKPHRRALRTIQRSGESRSVH
jgi:hypothetical protein